MSEQKSTIRLDDATQRAPLGVKAIKIRILSCGGTIDKVYFDASSEYQVGDPQIESIFREANVTFEFVIEQVLRKDSLEMSDEDRAAIRACVEKSAERQILITHGTDTMAETAKALKEIPDKVIVLTGSMTPAQFRLSDAEFNIGCAVGALQSQQPGVYIAMNGRIFPGDQAVKNLDRKIFEPR